jgi:hypothetical protein
MDVLAFRNWCAETGTELTPKEAKKIAKSYVGLKSEIEKAVSSFPEFYMEICNRTTGQKLDDIKRMKKKGCDMSLKEYNELQEIVKSICEIEGYDE